MNEQYLKFLREEFLCLGDKEISTAIGMSWLVVIAALDNSFTYRES